LLPVGYKPLTLVRVCLTANCSTQRPARHFHFPRHTARTAAGDFDAIARGAHLSISQARRSADPLATPPNGMKAFFGPLRQCAPLEFCEGRQHV
jgi:hypothetical protein